jgi:hypothetical protein
MYAIMAECVEGVDGATLEYMTDELTVTASHELAEAASDPDVAISKIAYLMVGNDAWAPDRAGGEIGDLCEFSRPLRIDTWAVQRIWNVDAAKASLDPCQPAISPVYYGAAPHTVIPAKKFPNGPIYDGYVVAEKGKTTNIEVDVFSSAPLPSPLSLVATKRGGGGPSADPLTAIQVTKGVTMNWSQPTAVNGDKVQLAITVAADAASSTTGTRFVIRSVLSATDYNQWPVILFIP